jgi:hypothetical protein
MCGALSLAEVGRSEHALWATLAVFLVILVGIPVYYATVGRGLVPPDATRRAAGEAA